MVTTVDSRWTHGGLTVDSQWTHSGLTVDSRWTHGGLTVDSQWTHSGLTVDSRWTHGVWTHGCGQRQRTLSRQQVARDGTAESLRLIPLPFPTLSLSVQPADRQGQRCMQLLSDTLDWVDGLDWALPRLLAPKG